VGGGVGGGGGGVGGGGGWGWGGGGGDESINYVKDHGEAVQKLERYSNDNPFHMSSAKARGSNVEGEHGRHLSP